MDHVAPDSLEFHLLNDYQHGFPLCSEPFAQMAQMQGCTQDAVLQTLRRLHDDGHISRVGAVFAPGRIGASTLAALSVAPEHLADVAAMVSRYPEVNHNYEREHRYNLWFVVTAGTSERLAAVLAEIEARSGLPVLRLPLLAQYHIDLGFHLGRGCAGSAAPRRPAGRATEPVALDAQGQALVSALQGGLPLVAQPYARIAQQLGWSEQQVLDRIGTWLRTGLLKRFGVVVRHHELGYTANAMVVHDIPDALVDELGQRIGRHPGVTLCYRRPRVAPDWPYNLFCMLHGRDRATVEQEIARLRASFGLQDYPHAVLFSRTRYKQQGARYAQDAATNAARVALES
jgi:DNA-binding Lrp family transcriptional regulator